MRTAQLRRVKLRAHQRQLRRPERIAFQMIRRLNLLTRPLPISHSMLAVILLIFLYQRVVFELVVGIHHRIQIIVCILLRAFDDRRGNRSVSLWRISRLHFILNATQRHFQILLKKLDFFELLLLFLLFVEFSIESFEICDFVLAFYVFSVLQVFEVFHLKVFEINGLLYLLPIQIQELVLIRR